MPIRNMKNPSTDIRNVLRMWLCFMYLMLVQCLGVPIPESRKLPARQWNPATNRSEPMKVYVGIYIESLGSFSATDMAFDVDIYIYESWVDHRLRHNHTDEDPIINDQMAISNIWLPDLYFANAREAKFQTVTVPNFALHVKANGTASYSARVQMNVACNLNLKNYPLDSQECSVRLLSYAHTKEFMTVEWFRHRPVNRNLHIYLPEMSISGLRAESCNGSYDYAITEHSRKHGEFSCLLAVMSLRRAIGYHLVQSYIPTALIVIISWVSFWIDRSAVPARGAGLRSALPPVSYAKAIDFWYGTCMLFVFAALLEFALVNGYMQSSCKVMAHGVARTRNGEPPIQKKYNKLIQSGMPRMDADESTVLDGRQYVSVSVSQSAHQTALVSSMAGDRFENTIKAAAAGLEFSQRALQVDKTCRILFPFAFALFNVIYWDVYALHWFF